jgi:hypothetical protein
MNYGYGYGYYDSYLMRSKSLSSDLVSIENVDKYCSTIEEFEHFTSNVLVDIKNCPYK